MAAVIEALDLKDATLVVQSTGGGKVARYIGRHGTKRVAKAILVSAIPQRNSQQEKFVTAYSARQDILLTHFFNARAVYVNCGHISTGTAAFERVR